MSMAERKTMTRAVKNPVKRKLTRAEKKEIAAVIQAAKGDGKPHTAQQTIPYLQMYPDGICRVTEKKYSKSLVFEDINYQLAQADDKTAIFENWCDFLNYFDASVSVQLSFINQGARKEKAQAAIEIPAQDDAFNSIRREYADMLKNQLEKGNNGLEKCKYITFSIEADNLAAAKARLSRIETDVLNNFKVLGVTARPMNGQERLNVLHGIFHPEGEPFHFSWDWLVPSGLTTKDFIAPSSFRFGDGRTFRMGRKLGAVSFLEILAPELNDRMLSDILDLENGIIVNLHIRSIDQSEAIKTIKRKITDLDKMKIEEQKKAVRSGYDMDIIPSDLATFGSEAKNLLQDLQSRNERMFLLTFLVVNMADTKRKLDNDVFATAGFAQKNNCALTRLDYLQEAGFMSSIPLGENLIPIQRGLTTSSTAIFIPFITQELFQRGAALYYGLNALSNNMILCDRKQLKNPNGLILGTPGSGKSFAAKREMTNAFLITDDDIIICDPEAEYFSLVQRLGGQVIRLSPAGKGMDGKPQYVNPMDINLNYSEDDNPLALKSDFILSLCELVIGGKEGLQPVEKTVIDRRIALMEQEGVVFRTGVDVGKDISAEELQKQYDAVVLACGSSNPRNINAPGRESKGIYYAVEFLKATTKSLINSNLSDGYYISAKYKNVIVIGGGDTGNDCVGTAIRHGCKSVIQLEMMPKLPDQRAENNPWPEWPRICKTDYGQEEAIAVFGHDPRIYQTTVKRFIPNEEGHLKAVETIKLQSVRDEKTGRMRMEEIPGSEQILEADLVLIAAGFLGAQSYVADAFGVNLNARTNVATETPDSYQTNVENVFTAGDMHRGQSLVVWAIREGREAARAVDEYLMHYSNL